MKRPKQTAQQRAFAKVQRAQQRLNVAAVNVCVAEDDDEGDGDEYQLAVTDLIAAAQKFALSLPRRELRRMVRK